MFKIVILPVVCNYICRNMFKSVTIILCQTIYSFVLALGYCILFLKTMALSVVKVKKKNVYQLRSKNKLHLQTNIP